MIKEFAFNQLCLVVCYFYPSQDILIIFAITVQKFGVSRFKKNYK